MTAEGSYTYGLVWVLCWGYENVMARIGGSDSSLVLVINLILVQAFFTD